MDSDNSNQETLDRSVYHPDKKHAKNNFSGFGDVMDRTVHYSPKVDNENKSFKKREENYQGDNLPTTLNSVRNETIKEHEELVVVSSLSDNVEIHNVKTKKLSQEKSMSLSENGSDFDSQIVSSYRLPLPINSDLLPPTDDFNVIPSIASSEVNQQKANSDVNQPASSDVYLQTTNCDVDQPAATADVYPKTASSVVYLKTVSSDVFKPTSSSDVYPSIGISDVYHSIVSTDVHPSTAKSDVSTPTANSDVRPPIASTDVHQLTASSDDISRYIPCLTFQ